MAKKAAAKVPAKKVPAKSKPSVNDAMALKGRLHEVTVAYTDLLDRHNGLVSRVITLEDKSVDIDGVIKVLFDRLDALENRQENKIEGTEPGPSGPAHPEGVIGT